MDDGIGIVGTRIQLPAKLLVLLPRTLSLLSGSASLVSSLRILLLPLPLLTELFKLVLGMGAFKLFSRRTDLVLVLLEELFAGFLFVDVVVEAVENVVAAVGKLLDAVPGEDVDDGRLGVDVGDVGFQVSPGGSREVGANFAALTDTLNLSKSQTGMLRCDIVSAVIVQSTVASLLGATQILVSCSKGIDTGE